LHFTHLSRLNRLFELVNIVNCRFSLPSLGSPPSLSHPSPLPWFAFPPTSSRLQKLQGFSVLFLPTTSTIFFTVLSHSLSLLPHLLHLFADLPDVLFDRFLSPKGPAVTPLSPPPGPTWNTLTFFKWTDIRTGTLPLPRSRRLDGPFVHILPSLTLVREQGHIEYVPCRFLFWNRRRAFVLSMTTRPFPSPPPRPRGVCPLTYTRHAHLPFL